jgi:hypothetical protein
LYATEIRWAPNRELPADCCDETEPDSPTEEPSAEDPATEAPATEEAPALESPTPEAATGIMPVAASTDAPVVSWQPYADPRADSALNVTTADDLAQLYVQLLSGEVVSPQASQEMLDLLARQEINDRLPVLLPEGTVVAHKTGNLDGLVHDAGVIYAPAGPIIVVVLTEDLSEGIAEDIIARMGLAAYEVMNQQE